MLMGVKFEILVYISIITYTCTTRKKNVPIQILQNIERSLDEAKFTDPI